MLCIITHRLFLIGQIHISLLARQNASALLAMIEHVLCLHYRDARCRVMCSHHAHDMSCLTCDI
jgi:hypothetical protein